MRPSSHGLPTFVRLGLLVLVGSVGCASKETTYLSVNELGARPEFETRATEFWKVGDAPRVERSGSLYRIAIPEFSVEFVQDESSSEQVDLARSLKLELPGVLYEYFLESLEEFESESIPLTAVTEASSYEGLEGKSQVEISTAELQGFEKDTTYYPVYGLLVLEPSQADQLQALVSELGVDAAVSVRLRLGARDGRAVIYPGSTFVVTTRDGSGELISQKALMSEGAVLEGSDPYIDETTLAVNSSQFVNEMKSLFKPYIEMAIVASRARRAVSD